MASLIAAFVDILHTVAFGFTLPHKPAVQAGDDAKRAFFMPMGEFLAHPCQVFEDHYFIVEQMLADMDIAQSGNVLTPAVA